MKKLLLLLVIMFSVQISYSQLGKGLSNTVDNTGYCYVTGVVNNAYGGTDIMAVKYDLYGDTLWTKTYPGTNQSSTDTKGVAIKAGRYGGVYVVGNVANTGSGLDEVLIKYDIYGNYYWAKTLQGTYNQDDKAFGIITDQNDNIYITGYVTGANNYEQMFIAKYDTYGNLLWANYNVGTDGLNTEGNSITLSNAGNVCVTGYTTTHAGGMDIYTVQYSSGGTLMWQKNFNGLAGAEDRAFGIAVDNEDNVIVAGYATNYASLTNTSIAVVKYSSAGDMLWRSFYGDSTQSDKAFGIAVDESDHIYVTGYSGNASLTSKNYITVCYNPDGTVNWGTPYVGPASNDQASSLGLVKDNTGTTVAVVVTGTSASAENNNDYETVAYDVTGTTVMDSRYSLDSTSDNVAQQLAVANDGTVYVTGFSQVIINAKITSAFKTQSLKWGSLKSHTVSANLPQKFSLYQNYPNPFNPSTNIRFDLSKNTNVKLTVYDLLGRQVSVLVDGYLTAGSHEVRFANSNLSSGIYFYELRADGFRDVRKMSLIK